mmetsp:Transcript_69267/g.137349  ORF Transcript_69267/g.137349 Transcript_69267/m.137349 type:complete len:96 (+) Transcript_69267:374-661(+)
MSSAVGPSTPVSASWSLSAETGVESDTASIPDHMRHGDTCCHALLPAPPLAFTHAKAHSHSSLTPYTRPSLMRVRRTHPRLKHNPPTPTADTTRR